MCLHQVPWLKISERDTCKCEGAEGAGRRENLTGGGEYRCKTCKESGIKHRIRGRWKARCEGGLKSRHPDRG